MGNCASNDTSTSLQQIDVDWKAAQFEAKCQRLIAAGQQQSKHKQQVQRLRETYSDFFLEVEEYLHQPRS